jgi:hypothetical protein
MDTQTVIFFLVKYDIDEILKKTQSDVRSEPVELILFTTGALTLLSDKDMTAVCYCKLLIK